MYTWGYYPNGAGGAERQAQLQAEALQRRGHQVSVICSKSSRPQPSVANGVRVHAFPYFRSRNRLVEALCLVGLFLFLMRRLPGVDVVHVYGPDLKALVIAFAAWIWRKPLYIKITSGGRDGDLDRNYHRLTKFWTVRRAAALQTLSAQITNEALAAGVKPSRIVDIPNAVDFARFQPVDAAARLQARERLGLPAAEVIVLYLGRFTGEKGLAVLSDAWARVVAPEAALLLVGSTAEEAELPEGIFAGRTAHTIVREWSNEPQAYYNAADVFVLPSLREGMSNALLEAMACGLAVACTAVGAAEAVVEDGVSGLIVPPGQPARLAAALQRLVQDPALRTRLGAAAASTAHARYAVDPVIDRIEAAYAAMLAGKAPN
ncbi:MAG TPA: glycosyltransferase family 4 protein [Dehalococcoidia bacterium]|nr:glycosyltransferase family 4 protein [Dehalococcoidia bacterium]